MERLIASQRELHGRIARTHENLKKAGTAKLSVSLVRSSLTVLESKWMKFEAQHDKLQDEYWGPLEKHEYSTGDFVSTVEMVYVQQRARLLELEQELAAPVVDEETKPTKAEPVAQRSVLPQIQLPQFSGKFEDWPAFRDLFHSLVVRGSSLSQVEKLHYLKTNVKGDADQLIRNLPSTEDNFECAWETLTSHFENKRLLVRSYLSAFTSLPRMRSDSAIDLRRIFYSVVSTVGALESIGRPIFNGTDLFVHLVIELLDVKTRREWENSLGKSSDPPGYGELREFLQEQLMTQEALRSIKGETSPSGKSSDKTSRTARALHVKKRGPESSRRCPICNQEHFIMVCEQYKQKSAKERRELTGTHRLCWNCLGRHQVSECPSQKTCTKCSGRHHTSLHDAFTAAPVPAVGASSSSAVHVAKRPPAECVAVLLATARVTVTDQFGIHATRALVDPGSETSLIAESLAQRLQLPRTPTSVAIYGVGGIQTGTSRGRIAVTLSSRTGHYSMNVSALALPRLSVYGGTVGRRTDSRTHLAGLELADPDFCGRDPIDLLLGADAYASIVLPDFRRGGPLEPIAQQTRLGWVILGAVGAGHSASAVSLQCTPVDELATLVRRFWEWEEPTHAALPLSAEEQECEDHFVRTHSRAPGGRYQVRLPVRPEMSNLTTTRRTATHMLSVMERHFERDAAFRDRYCDFMRDYASLGHMSLAAPSPAIPEPRVCYLPHHGVMKGSGDEAKIRVVFNGSSRTTAGGSLNDFLHTGPNLLPALADVLIRWRCRRYVVVGDIDVPADTGSPG